MQLLELTPAELTFLNGVPAAGHRAEPRLTKHLTAVLSARLRLPVQLRAEPVVESGGMLPTPVWQPDSALASLWLTRRLGGQRVSGVASFVPRTLIQTLDEVLAECWLDRKEQGVLPATLVWHMTADTTQSRLAVKLPPHATEMTNWARGVIKHG